MNRTVAGRLQEDLRKDSIHTFLSADERSIWVPVWTEADGEALQPSYFPARLVAYPGLVADVVPIASVSTR
jgi:hypothetical protein